MTADCTFSSSSVQAGLAFLYFTSGEFTINGNGHSIIGPTHDRGWVLYAQNAGTVLNLNNVTLTGTNLTQSVTVRSARLNARNVTFSGNTVNTVMNTHTGGGEIYLENARFLDNTGRNVNPNVISISTGGFASITGGVFQGNTNFDNLIASGGTVQLQGCLIFGSNPGVPVHYREASGGVITDNISCAKKKKKVPTAIPTATHRPLAATCVDLSQATGITVGATFGIGSGVQCQRLDGGGIGIQSIIDAGFIDAIDIWGYVDQGIEVCFPQAGRLIFLDASAMPRTAAPLASRSVNGMTCALIFTPGSIVLLPN